MWLSRNLRLMIKELLTNQNGKRFAAAIYLLERICKKVNIGKPEELRLLETPADLDKFKHCYAQIQLLERPFYFDLLRLSYEELMTLVERIQDKDCYLFRENNIDDPVVLDVGAHIGVFSLYALILKPKAKLYAFEPDKENYHILKLNLANFKNAFLIPQGILDKKGTMDFYLSKKIDWRSTLILDKNEFNSRFGKGELSSSYKVEFTDIDSFVAENSLNRLDFIKITVQPYEYLVLRGATNSIKRFHPKVAILVDKKNTLEIKKFFEDIGGYSEVRSSYPSLFMVFKPSLFY